MKTILLGALCAFLCVLSIDVNACTATTQYPTTMVTASVTTVPVQITTCNYGGEYAVISLPGAFEWTFTSSVSTDYIEITDLSNNTLASGTQPVSYTSTGADTIRMHIFTNSSCGLQSVCRTTTVTRGPCIASSQFPAGTINASASLNTVVTIDTCNYGGQYATVSLPSEGSFQFSSSDTNDYIYITTTSDSALGGGQSPYTHGASGAETVRMHIFSSSTCGMDSTCRTTSVQKIQCISNTLFPTTTVVTDSSILTAQTISTCNYPGEYAQIYVAGGLTWTFESSVSTDYLILTDTANNQITSGTSSISYAVGSGNIFRLHIFKNAGCGEESVCRTTTATRNPCIATTQNPTSLVTASWTYDTTFISTCNFAGEYAQVNLPFASSWRFFSSNQNDVIILTTLSDSVVQSGFGEIEYSSSGNETLKLHIFSNVLCGTESICRTTGILRLPCLGVEQYPLNNVSAPTDPEPDEITNCNWGGDYTYVLIDSGDTYEFSSDSSDWYVITDTSDNYFASGPTPITWSNPYGDTIIKVHIFTDSTCGIEQLCRVTHVTCTTCPVPVPSLSSSDSIACMAELPVTLSASNQFTGTVYWFAGSCGSAPIDSGGSIQVSPTSSTWYYVANSYETALSECDSFYLEVFDSPTISIQSLTNIECNGDSTGSISITSSGGVSPHQYQWSTNDSTSSVSNLPAGTYLLTVTDEIGCSNTDTFDLTQNPAIVATTDTVIDAECFDVPSGTLLFTVAGGVLPYSYLWSNGSTGSLLVNVIQGTYSVTITDDVGCEVVAQDSVSSPPEIIVTFQGTDTDCENDSNGSIAANATGGASSFSYEWNTGDTNSSISMVPSGEYYLTTTDVDGCMSIDTVSVGYQYASPVIPFSDTGVLCSGFSLFLDAGDSGTYLWSTGDTTQILQLDTVGTYSVTVTSMDSCVASKSIDIVQDSCVGILESQESARLKIFPNPASNLITIDVPEQSANNFRLRIHGTDGRLIRDEEMTSSNRSVNLNVGMLARGVYFVELLSAQSRYSGRFILQ